MQAEVEEPTLIEALRERLRGFFSNRKMIVAGLVIVGVGVDWFTQGVKMELEAIDGDRALAGETRARVFAIETIMEAEGLLRMADQEANGDAPEGGSEAGAGDDGESETGAGDGEGEEKADVNADAWTQEDNPTDTANGSTTTQIPGTGIPAE